MMLNWKFIWKKLPGIERLLSYSEKTTKNDEIIKEGFEQHTQI